MKNIKSQGSLEFLILIGAVAFFISIFFIVLSEKSAYQNKEKINDEVKNTAFLIQNEINLASMSSDGYTRIFKINSDINGEDYSANLTSGMVYIKTSKNSIAVPVSSVNGYVIKGENIIKKINGSVYLNP